MDISLWIAVASILVGSVYALIKAAGKEESVKTSARAVQKCCLLMGGQQPKTLLKSKLKKTKNAVCSHCRDWLGVTKLLLGTLKEKESLWCSQIKRLNIELN
ncbi:hypothetical protein QW180_05890 [Vibrio sinaloensis]|nr:hypothetical protein [Vibrio sinaloensis]